MFELRKNQNGIGVKMSRWDESYEDRREREREERREFENDVFYEVWRSGRDPDRIDYDRVDDARWDGASVDEAADAEIRAQQSRTFELEPDAEQEFCDEYPDHPEDDSQAV